MYSLQMFAETILGPRWDRARSSMSAQAHVCEMPLKHATARAEATCTGDVGLTLTRQFPDLRFVVQDRPLVVQQAEEVWAREVPEALTSGRLRLMAHDFFEEQPVKSAEVYVMRHIL